MKVLEMIVDSLINQLVLIDDCLFHFMLSRGTTDAMFIAQQL